MKSISCPKCGGPIRISETSSVHLCDYCGSALRDETQISLDSVQAISEAVAASLKRMSDIAATGKARGETGLEATLQSVVEERKRFEAALERARSGSDHITLWLKMLLPGCGVMLGGVVLLFVIAGITHSMISSAPLLILMIVSAVLLLRGQMKFNGQVIDPLYYRVKDLKAQEKKIRERMLSVGS